jgi:hypothetical protein
MFSLVTTALGFFTGGSFTRLFATALVVGSMAGWAGWTAKSWQTGRQDAQRIERQARDTLRQIERAQQAADTFTQEQQNAEPTRQTIVRTVEKIVQRPVYRNVCLDADGLQQLGAAIATGAPAGGAAAPLPTPQPTR